MKYKTYFFNLLLSRLVIFSAISFAIVALMLISPVSLKKGEAIGCNSGSITNFSALSNPADQGVDNYINWSVDPGCTDVYFNPYPGTSNWMQVNNTGQYIVYAVSASPPETYELRAFINDPPLSSGDVESHTADAVASLFVQANYAYITVTEVGTDGATLSGGTYTLNGTVASPNNQVYGNSYGTPYTLASVSPPNGYGAPITITSTVPPNGSTITAFPGGNYGFTITYTPNSTPPPPLPPKVDIKANGSDGPISVSYGSSVTLSWDTSGGDPPTGCTASNDQSNPNWTGSKNINGGSQSSGSITYPTTFTIDCSNTAKNYTDSVVVNISAGGAPTNLTVMGDTCGKYYLQVSWDKVAGASYYELFDNGTFKTTVPPSAFSRETYNDTGLTPDSTHSYTVRAVYPWGASTPLAGPVSGVVAPACPSGPSSAPTGLNATASAVCGSGTINVSWNSVSGATSYTLRDGALTIYPSGSNLSFPHTGLPAGSSHSYTVRAENVSNSVYTSYSSPVVATAPSACPNASPVANAGPDKSITLPTSTSAPTGATATDSDGTVSSTVWSQPVGQGATITNGNTLTPSFSGMTSAGTYTFTLTVTDNLGATHSDSMTVTVSSVALPDLVASNLGPNTAVVGTPLQFTATVRNSGTASTGASFNNRYRIINTANGATTSLAAVSMNTLAAGASSVATSPSYTFTSAGTYNVQFCVDTARTIAESNETNNCPAVQGIVIVSSPSATITVIENGASGGSWVISPGGFTNSPATVSPAAAPGGTTYTITVNSAPLNYTVSSITSSDGGNTVNLIDGQSKTFTINYSAVGNTPPVANAGPDKSITLPTSTSAPTGATATDSDGTVSSTVWSQPVGQGATITNGNTLTPSFSGMTSAGTYTFTLTVTDNLGATHSDSMTVTVSNAPTPFSFNLTPANSSVSVTSGSSVTNQINAALISGTTESITFTSSGFPSGTTVSYANQGCQPNCAMTLQLTVPAGATSGTYTVNVTGTSASASDSTSFTLQVNAPVALTVVCSVVPTTAQVGQSVTWTAVASGGTGPYTYSWGGTDIPTAPAPSSNPYVISYATVGIKSGAVLVTDTSDGSTTSCASQNVQVNVKPVLIEF